MVVEGAGSSFEFSTEERNQSGLPAFHRDRLIDRIPEYIHRINLFFWIIRSLELRCWGGGRWRERKRDGGRTLRIVPFNISGAGGATLIEGAGRKVAAFGGGAGAET